MSVTNNAARQWRFRSKTIENGWVQCNVWVSAAALPDMQLQAELLRKHPHLTVGPLQRQVRRAAGADGAAARRLRARRWLP